MKNTNINHLNNLQNEVLRGLAFYEDELRIVQERLEEIASNNTHREVMEGVEHFQNQLIIQRNNIDELKHKVNVYLDQLKEQLTNSPDFAGETLATVNTDLYNQYIVEEKTINELRHEFNRFAAKWL